MLGSLDEVASFVRQLRRDPPIFSEGDLVVWKYEPDTLVRVNQVTFSVCNVYCVLSNGKTFMEDQLQLSI